VLLAGRVVRRVADRLDAAVGSAAVGRVEDLLDRVALPTGPALYTATRSPGCRPTSSLPGGSLSRLKSAYGTRRYAMLNGTEARSPTRMRSTAAPTSATTPVFS
jgi:hypothetical protein